MAYSTASVSRGTPVVGTPWLPDACSSTASQALYSVREERGSKGLSTYGRFLEPPLPQEQLSLATHGALVTPVRDQWSFLVATLQGCWGTFAVPAGQMGKLGLREDMSCLESQSKSGVEPDQSLSREFCSLLPRHPGHCPGVCVSVVCEPAALKTLSDTIKVKGNQAIHLQLHRGRH